MDGIAWEDVKRVIQDPSCWQCEACGSTDEQCVVLVCGTVGCSGTAGLCRHADTVARESEHSSGLLLLLNGDNSILTINPHRRRGVVEVDEFPDEVARLQRQLQDMQKLQMEDTMTTSRVRIKSL